jgi:hypothetical protein
MQALHVHRTPQCMYSTTHTIYGTVERSTVWPLANLVSARR